MDIGKPRQASAVEPKVAPLSFSPVNVTSETSRDSEHGAVDSARRKASHVAILVCHGMGQQVQFETLDTVARAVQATAQASHGAVGPDVSVSVHPSEGRFLGRAELRLSDAENGVVEAHFFEAYWAPLTEGKITLRQTLNFLQDAGIRGLRFAYREGVFDRWMFGCRQEFEIPAPRVLHLGLALWILFLITLAFSTLALVPVLKLVDLLRGIASADFAVAAAASYALAASILIAAVFGLIAAFVLRGSHREADPIVGHQYGSLAPSIWSRSAMVLALAIVITLASWVTYRFGSWMYRTWLGPLAADPGGHSIGLAAAALAFVLEFILLRMFAQRFLVQFVGDVAAYISPFKVSTFEEIRHDIQDRARAVAKFIYESNGGNANEPRYDRIIFVGHSLGSVIAYDSINDSINRDIIDDGWGPGTGRYSRNVAARTRLLLTFGSPLDKTAFIFRTQRTNAEMDLRDALSTLLQPLIVDYNYRLGAWINLWSPSDWISGRLTYYDAPNTPSGEAVCNLRNTGAVRPWVAHTRYWTDPLFSAVLFTALTGKPALTLKSQQQAEVLAAAARVYA